MTAEHQTTNASHEQQWETLLSEVEIDTRVKELAIQIAEDYQGKNLLIVGILRGAFIFTADLVRELEKYLSDLEIDFIAISSYSDEDESSRAPRIDKDLNTNIENYDVLVIEDIVDTGYSFEKLLKILLARNPKSLKTCALLSKPGRREIEVPIDYLGFSIEDRWVKGYGLDSKQKGRATKDIVAEK